MKRVFKIKSFMLKIISLLVVMTMLAAIGLIPVAAADSSLVFELDLSNYNDTTGAGMANSAGDGTTIAVAGAVPPAIDTITTPFGEQTKVLTFEKYENGTKKYGDRNIKITDSSFSNQDNQTISFWLYQSQTNSDWDTVIRLGGANGLAFQVVAFNGYYYTYYPSTSNFDTGSFGMRTEQWRHIVFNRTYNEETSKWNVSLYINGSNSGFAQFTNNSGGKINEDDFVLQFGNFCGSIGDVKVYNKTLTPAEISELYSKEINNYKEGVEGIALESVTPESGELPTAAGEIKLTFTNYVDKDSLDGITLLDSEGNPAAGKILAYLPEEVSKEVIIKYGELKDGEEYRLIIPAGISSLNGYETGENPDVVYQTVSNVIFYEDFENMEEGVVEGIEGLSPISDWTTDSWSSFMIHTDENTGRKYMDYIANKKTETASDAATFLYWYPDDAVKDSDIVIEMKFRGSQRGLTSFGAGGVARTVMGVSMVGDSSNSFSSLSLTSTGAASFSGTNHHPDAANFTTVADDEGWHNLKTIIGTTEDGQRYVDYYYDSNNPEKFCRVMRNDKDWGSLTSVILSRAYLTIVEEMGKSGVSFDEIKISKYVKPSVIHTEDSEKIYFSCDIDEESLETAEIYYENEENEIVKASFASYDETDRALTVSLSDYLMFGKTYKLYIKGAKTADGAKVPEEALITVETDEYGMSLNEYSFKNELGNVVDKLSGAQQIRAFLTVKNDTDGLAEATAIFIHTDKNGRIKSAKKESAQISPNSEWKPQIIISDSAFSTDDIVRMYIWDKTIYGSKPVLLEPVVLPFSLAE